MSLAGKTVFVTGSTGFLGGALVRRLASEGAHVKALARRPNRDAGIRHYANVEIVAGNITNREQIEAVMLGSHIVYHTAVSYGNLEEQRRVNVEGTRNVVVAAANTGARRVVHVSSIAAYGYSYRGEVSESMPLNPSQEAYSLTKAEAEKVVRSTAHATGIAFSIARPGGIYGPHAGLWTRQLFRLATRSPRIFVGHGEGYVPFIYVDDLIDLLVLMGEHPHAEGSAFNAVYDPPHTWREILDAYAELAGKADMRWIAIPPAVLRPFVGVAGLVAPRHSTARTLPEMLGFLEGAPIYHTDLAREMLNWEPKVSLGEGVRRCVPYLREKGLLS